MAKKFTGRFTFFILAFFVSFSCDDDGDELSRQKELRYLDQYLEINNITVEPEESGLYFIPVNEGDGLEAESDDWVIIRYTGKTIRDIIIETTDEKTARDNGIFSSSIVYGDRRLPLNSFSAAGVIQGIKMMQEGGSATFIVPSHLAYGRSGSRGIPPYTTLIYDVDLVKVIKDPELYEKEIIEDYIELYNDSTFIPVKQESGLYYIEIIEGTEGETPENSQQASVYYTGSFVDGRVFDSNIGGQVYRVTLGADETIFGFEEGIKLMKKNGKSRILIPSSLGYGKTGSGNNIPGYTPLVFDIELVDVETGP